MVQTTARRTAYLVTILAPGLYAGRVLSELLRPGLPVAISITLLTSTGGIYLLYRLSPRRAHWPVLPLYAYVLYPALHPGLALAAAATALIAARLSHAGPGQRRLSTLSPRLLASLIFLLSFVVYLQTLAPGLLPADSGELQLVAARLGVAHPPGFALYTMLAHLATRLPLGPTAAYRANLLSALIASATLSLIFLSALHLTRSRLAALVAVFALGSATTFWSQATTANVRVLTAFFAALAIYLLLTYHQQTNSPTTILFLFALTLSLGVTHHASFVFMALVFALAILWLDPTILRQPSRWRWPAAGLLLGLLPLLYFPIRALTAEGAPQPVRGVAPELATLPGFLQHVLALGFRGDLFAYTAPRELWARLQVMGNVMTFQFHWLLLAGMLLGIFLLLRARPKIALTLGAAFALHTVVTATYRAPQTVEYMLPAYVPAALTLAVAAATPLRRNAAHTQRALQIKAMLAAVLFVAALAQGLQHYPSLAQLSQDRTARQYGAAILQQAPPSSIVLADWHWATPLWYLQEVERQRPDLQMHYVFPTAESYGATWARRIAENLDQGYPVVATHFDAAAYAALPAAEPLGDAFLFAQEPRTSLPADYTSLDQTLGAQIDLLGYHLDEESLSPLREALLTVAWRPASAADPQDITLFAHLVNAADGAIYAQQDVPLPPARQGITLTQLRFTPRLTAQPGDYLLYVGAYETATARALAPADGATRSLLQTVRLQAMDQPPYTAQTIHAPTVSGEQQLVGYDWDHTLALQTRLYLHWRTPAGYLTEAVDNPPPGYQLPAVYGPWGLIQQRAAISHAAISRAAPQYYVPLGAGIVWTGSPQLASQSPPPGTTISLVQHFAAGRPLQQDLVVSVRLIGYEPQRELWAWWDLHDAVPALGAIPTLKWIDGSHIRDPHFLTVSPTAPSGQTLGALVTLYDAFTQRPLPILDQRITAQHLGIPLGAGKVR